MPLQQHISIGKFLRPANKVCPQRNHFLGESFCRLAVNLKVYTDACSKNGQGDTNLLHNKRNEMISMLDLSASQGDDSSYINLPSTGRLLSASINKSLNEWKRNAPDQVRVSWQNITRMVKDNNYLLLAFSEPVQ